MLQSCYNCCINIKKICEKTLRIKIYSYFCNLVKIIGRNQISERILTICRCDIYAFMWRQTRCLLLLKLSCLRRLF